MNFVSLDETVGGLLALSTHPSFHFIVNLLRTEHWSWILRCVIMLISKNSYPPLEVWFWMHMNELCRELSYNINYRCIVSSNIRFWICSDFERFDFKWFDRKDKRKEILQQSFFCFVLFCFCFLFFILSTRLMVMVALSLERQTP